MTPTLGERPSERDAFERWAADESLDLSRLGAEFHYSEDYEDATTSAAWSAWQAVAAAALEEAAKVCDELAKIASAAVLSALEARPITSDTLHDALDAAHRAEAHRSDAAAVRALHRETGGGASANPSLPPSSNPS